jgi:hypothetical protein
VAVKPGIQRREQQPNLGCCLRLSLQSEDFGTFIRVPASRNQFGLFGTPLGFSKLRRRLDNLGSYHTLLTEEERGHGHFGIAFLVLIFEPDFSFAPKILEIVVLNTIFVIHT